MSAGPGEPAAPRPNQPRPLLAELCFQAPLVLDAVLRETLLRALHTALGGGLGAVQDRVLGPAKDAWSAALLCLPERLPASEEGAAGLIFRFGSNKLSPADPALRLSLSQSWQWAEAARRAPAAPFRLSLSELHTLGLAPGVRLALFQKSLYAATRLLNPAALHFPQSQCLAEPAAYLENRPESPEYLSVYGLVNNRVFSNSAFGDARGEGPVFMDTLGLHLLGLPDLQCAAQPGGADCAELSFWLYNLAEHCCSGPGALSDGDIVLGPGGREWALRAGPALSPPGRLVLDVQSLRPAARR